MAKKKKTFKKAGVFKKNIYEEKQSFGIKERMINFTIMLLVSYLVVMAIMFSFQRTLMYHPAKKLYEPRNYGLNRVRVLGIEASDGIKLTAWYQAPSEKQETILYFHGNAGHLGDRADKLSAFINAGYGLMAVSYRGYGTSEGKPDEEGIYNDARASIKYLEAMNVEDKNIIIFGESLGSGVAVKMATEFPVRAVVLEAPYTSVANRAAEMYPFLPVKLLIKDTFDSINIIKDVKVPVLILHGELDETIPIEHGRKLYEQANFPKKAVYYPTVGHTNFDAEQLAREITDFLSTH